MKKKSLIVIIILILIIVLVLSMPEKKAYEKALEIPEYQSDILCSMNGVDKLEDTEYSYTLNVYLTLKDEFVTKAIYQSISTNTDYTLNLEYMNLYNTIDGINGDIQEYGDKMVLTITYNYEVIKLSEIKNKVGNLLSDDSLFKKAKKLPVSYEDFKEYELSGFSCK